MATPNLTKPMEKPMTRNVLNTLKFVRAGLVVAAGVTFFFEETGPNPVDTYRTQDIEKLGVRNATDLLVRLPQEAGGTITQNIANGGDGSVIPNLRGLLPKETLVLVDGKRVAISGLGGSGGQAYGVDI